MISLVGHTFAKFDVRSLDLGFAKDAAGYDRYLIGGEFRLDPESDGVDPLSEDVIVTVGPSKLTIPAGSLTRDNARYSCRMKIDSADVGAIFADLGDGQFAFMIDAQSVDLTGATNPVPVSLRIFNDWGEATKRLGGRIGLDEGVTIPGSPSTVTPVPVPRVR